MFCTLVRAAFAAALTIAIAQPAAAQSPVPSADVAALLGVWTATFDGPEGPFSMAVTLSDNAGSLAAKVTSDAFPAGEAGELKKTDKGVSFAFTIDAQGMTVPTVLSVTPDGDKASLFWDLADGQFSLSGSATKTR